jgi:hypothetical protein
VTSSNLGFVWRSLYSISSDLYFVRTKMLFPIHLNNKSLIKYLLVRGDCGEYQTWRACRKKTSSAMFWVTARPSLVPNFLLPVYIRLAQHEYPPSFQSLRYVQIQQHVRFVLLLFRSNSFSFSNLDVWTETVNHN